MLTWIAFWLSVALIPLSIWFHRWIPPFTWSNTSAANTSRSWLFGLVVIGVRLLLQLPAIFQLGLRPPAIAVPSGVWLILTFVVFLAVEATLALLHTTWLDRATGADRRNRPSIRLLAPGYFLALALESTAVGWLLRAGG